MITTRKAIVLTLVAAITLAGAISLAGCGKTAPEQFIENTQQNANAAVRDANLRTIDGAVQFYYAEKGQYPGDISQLVPEFLKTAPVDPAGGTYYLVDQGGTVRAAVK